MVCGSFVIYFVFISEDYFQGSCNFENGYCIISVKEANLDSQSLILIHEGSDILLSRVFQCTTFTGGAWLILTADDPGLDFVVLPTFCDC